MGNISLKGTDGTNGTNGVDGTNGTNGADGVSAVGAITGLTVTTREDGSAGNTFSVHTSGVASVSCNSGEKLTGGFCSCNHDDFSPSTTNFGVVMFCATAGISVIGSCVSDIGTHQSSKYGPPITVQAVCMSATTIGTLSVRSSTSKIPAVLSDETKAVIQHMEEQALLYEQLMQEKVAKQE